VKASHKPMYHVVWHRRNLGTSEAATLITCRARQARRRFPINIALATPKLLSFSPPSKCSGFTLTSEDSSEVAFLLVENYNYDRSSWSSDRLGIFDSPIVVPFR